MKHWDTRDSSRWPHAVELQIYGQTSYDEIIAWLVHHLGEPDAESLTSQWTFTAVYSIKSLINLKIWVRDPSQANWIALTWS